MPKLSGLVAELRTERDRAQKELEQLNAALAALGGLGHGSGGSSRDSRSQEAETHVRRRPQTNCCGSALALGEMEAYSP